MPGGQHSSSCDESVGAVIGDLCRSIKGRECVVFCGAGISRNSGIPLVVEFEDHLLTALKVHEMDRSRLIRSDLPFEAFMEVLQLSNGFGELLSVYSMGLPNSTHRLLARMMKAGYVSTVVTTNFDTLIEQALENEGLQKGRGFVVVSRDSDFTQVEWDMPDQRRLLKIHGCISCRDELAVILKRVAAKRLSEPRGSVIDHVFSGGPHSLVLVLGYSCSDMFDVNPRIEAIQGTRKVVYFVSHSAETAVEAIEVQDNRNPFKAFSGSLRLHHDTDSLVRDLYRSVLGEECEPHAPHETSWRESVSSWVSRQSRSDAQGFVAELFHRIADYPRSKYYSNRALRTATDPSEKYVNTYRMGCSYAREGKHKKAMASFAECIKDNPDPRIAMIALNGLGGSYSALSDYGAAKRCYEESLRLAQQLGDVEHQATCLQNLGTTTGHMAMGQSSSEYLRQALTLAQREGYKDTECTALQGLAENSLARGETSKARAYSEESLRIAEQIGNSWQRMIALASLGNIHHSLKDNTKAIEYAEKALAIANEVGDPHRITAILNNLGAAHGDLRHHRDAIRYYERGLRLARQIGDAMTEGVIANNLGTNYYAIGEFQRAADYHDHAAQIFVRILPSNHPYVTMAVEYKGYAQAKLTSGAG